jgi:hypothetical protein
MFHLLLDLEDAMFLEWQLDETSEPVCLYE